MPVDVPKKQKVYTTKYENWRGVDYTNDASNVWYRRSPNGLNMLPNLDGQPFKRNGWKIELSAQDFIEASGITGVTEVEQYKVDYFELGGAEYLWFYTSIGCFYYTGALTFVDTSYEIGDDEPYEFSKSQTYDVGDYCMCNGTMYKCISAISTPTSTLPQNDSAHWTATETIGGQTVPVDGSKPFPPTNGNIDYSKSFFFEGQGRAGYYIFVNDQMFWFDGEKLHEAKATIPVVLTMADHTGVGTLLEQVNMLTPWRAIDYVCDGSATQYIIPDGAESVLNVFTINADGSFTPNYDWTMPDSGILNFSNPPQETRPNQPSMRVVYKTANATFSEQEVTSQGQSIKIKRTTTKKQPQKYVNKKWQANGSATTTTAYACTEAATFALTNAKMPLNIKVDTTTWMRALTDSWDTNVSDITLVPTSYGDSVTLTGGSGVCSRYPNETGLWETKVTYTNVKSTTRTQVTTTTAVFNIDVRIRYDQWKVSYGEAKDTRGAFFAASKSLVFGNGIINQVFMTASKYEAFSTRVWYSAATDPTYFPDTNYIEVGATDKHIMGLIKVDDFLGIIKQGSATDTSVYLAYPTSFEDITTYAVKQSVNGVGAISNGAFNSLNGEPLFLSAEGVMGIEPAEDESRKIRNRSYYINKPLLSEPSLESAFSFVFNGMYWLCVNDHCYVLDGSQKISWENSKTNLQYEAYYLENIPAKCFARKDGRLWFIDNLGNACRFRDDNDDLRYVDAYDAKTIGDGSVVFTSDALPTNGVIPFTNIYERSRDRSISYPDPNRIDYILDEWYTQGASIQIEPVWLDPDNEVLSIDDVTIYFDITIFGGGGFEIEREVYGAELECVNGVYYAKFAAGNSAFLPIEYPDEGHCSFCLLFMNIHVNSPLWLAYKPEIPDGAIIQYNNDKTRYYTVTGSDETSATVVEGVPIKAVWSTIADDDGSAHYYKKLQKRGSLVAVMPMSDSGVKVYLIADEKDPVLVGETDIGTHILPFNYYLRKKVKNYKRLQIVCENATYNDGFGIDEIIKSYTIGNYAKR